MFKINKSIIPPQKVYFLFVIANLLSLSKLAFFDLKAGMILSILMVIIFALNTRTFRINWLHSFFIIYFVLELLSLLNYIFIPISRNLVLNNPQVITQSISFLIVPQLFFFISGSFIGNSPDFIKINLEKIIFVNFFLILIGILFYFIRPAFFLKFQRELFPGQFDYYHGFFPRLTSYMSSLVVGVVCSTNFVLTLEYIKKRFYKIILLCTFAAGSFLSMERGSWVMISFGTILYFAGKIFYNNMIVSKPKIRIRTFRIILFIILFLVGTSVFLSKNLIFDKFFTEVEHKVLNFFNAFSERNDTWGKAAELSFKYPFGLGLGLLSHKGAQNNSLYSVADGNYFRILGDIGYAGFIAFILLIFLGLFMLFKKRMLSLMIVLFIYSMQAIGTNVFDLYYISFIFWFILGIAYSSGERDYIKNLSDTELEHSPD